MLRSSLHLWELEDVRVWWQLTFRQTSLWNEIIAFSFPVFIFSGKTLQTTVTLESASQIQELELTEWEGKTEDENSLCASGTFCLWPVSDCPCQQEIRQCCLFNQIWLPFQDILFTHLFLSCAFSQIEQSSTALLSCTAVPICPVDWMGCPVQRVCMCLSRILRTALSCGRLSLSSPRDSGTHSLWTY